MLPSGGIHSSLITALLQTQSSTPVRTFTIGFEEPGFKEAPYSRAVAVHLGTEHTETLLTAADAQALIPSLPRFYTEPFADASQLPTHLVCREARRAGLTVALSGDGGDELFGSYASSLGLASGTAWPGCPGSCGASSARPFACCCHAAGMRWVDHCRLPGHKAYKLANHLAEVHSVDDLFRSLVSEWRDPAALLQPCPTGPFQELSSPLDWPLPQVLCGEPVARMMTYDTLNYLPNDILTKVDRAAMATSLETRALFLDHRVAALAWRLPMAMKIRANTGQWALGQILYKHVPRELIERPKMGFGIRIGPWLRAPRRPWVEDLLNPVVMQSQGCIRPEIVQLLWRQHLSGR